MGSREVPSESVVTNTRRDLYEGQMFLKLNPSFGNRKKWLIKGKKSAINKQCKAADLLILSTSYLKPSVCDRLI